MPDKKIILRADAILRPGDDPPILEAEEIYIQGGRIAAVGPQGERFAREEADEVHDLPGAALMAGLVNAHTHMALTFLRGVAADADLGEFFSRMTPHEHLVSREHAYWAVRLALVEMIRAGITTVVDMFEWMDITAQAVKESGLRAGLVSELAGVRPEPRGARGSGFSLPTGRLILDDQYGMERLAQAEEEIEGVLELGSSRLTPMLGPHSLYSCSPELLAEAAEAAGRLGVSLCIHLAENQSLERQVRQRYGSTAKIMRETGLLERHVLGVHCIYLKPEEVEQVAAHSFGMAHCPGSNLKLGERPAPVERFLEAGIPVGLGTDSVMSNDNLDILEEARLAALIHKGNSRRAGVLPGDTALQMATGLGAEAIGLPEIGKVRPGYMADLIVVDLAGPHWHPGHEPMMNLLYAANSRDVRAVMVGGEWVMWDRAIRTLDEAAVVDYARRITTSRLPGKG